jgi:molybdopterin molybdotransferase
MSVDCCSVPGLMPFDEALKRILDSVKPVKEIETIPINLCLDRILAENILSTYELPPWHCSAMDGYALNSQSYIDASELILVGNSFAGHPYQGNVLKGQCIRIMTGAVLPDDCDVVVMQENVSVDDERIKLNISIEAWQHVRKAGSEVSRGAHLLSKGQRINPRNIGVIASMGISQINVYRKLKVALFSTGDELVLPGHKLQAGQIYDSNRFSIAAVCERLGYDTINLGLVEDNKGKIKTTMLQAASKADVLLTSGGVSVGEADYVKPILEEIGQLELWKVAIKPGKPIAIGSIDNCKFFGLPGNPVSAMVTLNLLVKPAMQKLSGMVVNAPKMFIARCITNLRKKPGRRDYQRGVANIDQNGNWHVSSTGVQGSAKLTSLADANCYIVLDEHQGNVSAGDTVNIQLFDESIL